MNNDRKCDLLLVGASPPPYHGQALITGQVFGANWAPWRTQFIEARFSHEISEVGSLQLRKLLLLVLVASRMMFARFGRGAEVLYITSGSAKWIPLIRDAILIGCVGRFFKRTVVHYHSGGLPEWFEESRLARFFGRIAYGGVDVAIALSKDVPVPCFEKTKVQVVPNGLSAPAPEEVEAEKRSRFTLVFIGSLRESKGVNVVLDAVSRLEPEMRQKILVRFMGSWSSVEYEKETLELISSRELEDCIEFDGVVIGDRKWEILAGSNVFVFPSHYESENQPLVVIEAMAMGLPVIASRWRGIPELLDEGETGILIHPNSPDELADVLKRAILQQWSSEEMGQVARERYLENFSEEAFVRRMKGVMKGVIEEAGVEVRAVGRDSQLPSKKLLIVSPTPPPMSGPEVMTRHLLNSSLKESYELIHYNIGKERDISKKGVFDLINVCYGLFQPFVLAWKILRCRPSAMYTNLPQNVGGFARYAAFIWVAWLFRVPVVTRVMGDGFSHFYRRVFGKWFVRRTLARISQIIVRAKVLRNQFGDLVPRWKLRVIYSGIDVGEFVERRLSQERKRPLKILFVGYLTHAKGAFDLLRVIPEVIKEEPDVQFRMMGAQIGFERNVVYAEGLDRGRSQDEILQELRQVPEVEQSVEFLGVKNGEEKVREFLDADILIHPSHAEAFPTVILEAMAAGLPVVTTPVGVLPEAFDERAIRFVPVGDLAELKAATLEMIRHPELREKMGSYNWKNCRENFTLDSYGERLRGLFDDLLGVQRVRNHGRR